MSKKPPLTDPPSTKTPLVALTPYEKLHRPLSTTKRKTRPGAILDLRPEAIERRKKDPLSLRTGRERVDLCEDLVNELVEAFREGNSVKTVSTSLGFDPRVFNMWLSKGRDEYEFRENGEPCKSCMVTPGIPEGCNKCQFSGVLKYEPRSVNDIYVDLFIRVQQARAQFRRDVENTISSAATERQKTIRTQYGYEEDEETKERVAVEKSKSVTDSPPDWLAADSIVKRIELGEKLAAFGRTVEGRAKLGNRGVEREVYEEVSIDPDGLLVYRDVLEVKGGSDDSSGVVDITKYLGRFSDNLKIMLMKEIEELRYEDVLVRKNMEARMDGKDEPDKNGGTTEDG